ncbi:uncharacterized protein [Salminus brasiliensis]|uniref:uncharacterized protein n=1 Tax=Salminus brasiliensis TaxID=930266 RepID=UPI003B82E3C5
MNGALYTSFFQGQLESALEQVVQLAVQEITKSVGASLGSMLLETASKEQENQRLRAKLQGEDGKARGAEEPAGTKAELRGSCVGLQADTLRLEQKRRAVGQLKMVMERVLEFAVCELTKIVEDSFDDLLLELTKTEREHEKLRAQLQEIEDNGVRDEETQEQENRTDSPGSSEGAGAKEQGQELTENTNESEPDRQAVITVSQDWVPILDKVFGQKWCSDLWQIKELSSKEERPGSGVVTNVDSLIRESLAPTSQRNAEVVAEVAADPPQWLPTPDTEVATADPQCTSVSSSVGDESQLKSPSMLHRLLTLPSQLLEDDEESMEALPSLAEPEEAQVTPATPGQSSQREKVDSEDGEEESQEEGAERDSSRIKGGKKLHVCKECGKKFGRPNLLKVHRQTHKDKDSAASCPECGKHFSHPAKLQAHLRTHSGKTT